MARVLVCGGRDFSETQRACTCLDRLRVSHSIETVIDGGARGADGIASFWARSRGLENVTFKADWRTHGKAAGPIRNQRMIDEGKPDLVVAFPGGRGTADMVRRAEAAGVPVIAARLPSQTEEY